MAIYYQKLSLDTGYSLERLQSEPLVYQRNNQKITSERSRRKESYRVLLLTQLVGGLFLEEAQYLKRFVEVY